MRRSLLAALALLSMCADAAEVAGVGFPDELTIDDHKLVLNGAGVRTATWLKLNVYAAALYLPARESDPQRIVDSDQPRVIHMQFLRDVGRDDTLKAWDWSFAKNCVAPCVLPLEQIRSFQAYLPDSRAGDTQTYRFYADRVEVLGSGRPLGRTDGAPFVRLLLSTWIGAEPPTAELKRALLGLQTGP